jgi:hypothetical protein
VEVAHEVAHKVEVAHLRKFGYQRRERGYGFGVERMVLLARLNYLTHTLGTNLQQWIEHRNNASLELLESMSDTALGSKAPLAPAADHTGDTG